MSGSFSPTPGEQNLVNAIFAQGDPNKVGILTGDVAVRLFGGAKVPPQTLGEIWAIADEENNGWLSRKGAAIAVRLMGHAQNGESVNKALINKPGPLPSIEGISPIVPQATGSALKAPPLLTPQDRNKFFNMFVKAGPVNGLLSGEKARDIFVKSKLPTDKLLQIWNLADTQDRGALDATDFAIGMYFIQAVMSGTLSFIPTSLPPGLYQQASGGPAPPTSIPSHSTGGSSSNFSPVANAFPQNRSQIQPQYTGQPLQPDHTGFASLQQKPHAPQLPNRPSPASAIGSSAFGHQTAPADVHWDVTPAEKATADNFFNTLDTARRGYIEGDVAVPFMLESKLPEDDLAQIWDLADLNNDGRLTKEGFAVAMHLIQTKLKGIPLPATLPATLVPPTMRGTGASPFSPPATQTTHQPPPPPEPQQDLFSWDDPIPSPIPATNTGNALNNIPAQTTGGAVSSLAPQTTGPMSRQMTGQHTSSPQPPSVFSSPARHDPFGSSFTSPSKSLLDDDDEGPRPAPVEDKSAEIGNVQNQLNSTNKSLETAKAERSRTEQDVANQAGQLAALQTQLSSAKAAYETETTALNSLKDRFNNQAAEINKTREELIRAESDLSAIRVEKAEIEGAFLRDKEDVRDLQRKMIEAGQQVEALKAETEKLKKEAKQQKGRLAIAKKQLSTKEAERAKVQKEQEESQTELVATTKEADAIETQLAEPEAAPAVSVPAPERTLSQDSVAFAATQPLPATPEIGAQSPASVKSNNPFERLALGSSPSSRTASPFQASSPDHAPSPNGVASDAPATSQETPAPLNFADAFEDPTPAPSVASPATANGDSAPATPKANTPIAVNVPEPGFLDSKDAGAFVSPATTVESDSFVTPPSTATPEIGKDTATFPDLDVNKVELGPTTSVLSATEHSFPGAFPADQPAPAAPVTNTDKVETDLNSNLKELEVEESDSSDEEDDVPLSTLAKGKAPEVPPATNGLAKQETSFDDVFNLSPPSEVTPAPQTNGATDAFGAPVHKEGSSPFDTSDNLFEASLSPSASQNAPVPQVAGVDAFDEAMGLTKGKGNSPVPAEFSFDTTFDDNFDFGSAGGTSFPPAPAPATNGDAPKATETKPATSFDDIFNTGPEVTQAAPAVAQTASSPPPAAAAPTSFDEAFSGFDTGPKPDLSLSQSTKSNSTNADLPASESSAHFPAAPASPKSDHSVPRVSKSSSSSHRPASPPPRTMSPKPSRPSTATSSKDGHEKVKEHGRTSKLSIRLPFGKKKKQPAEPMPAPPSLLSPPQEVPSRQGSPAVDDDVEAVKQLTAMGFSRSQAVGALEKYSYDVPRALNSLLGQS